MSTALYAGIDNGLNGGVCFIDNNGEVVEVHVMPILKSSKGKNEYDLDQMAKLFKEKNVTLAALEKAQAFPGQGVTSTFSTGMGFGIWKGILSALQIPYIIVPAQTWQGEVLAGMNRDDTKVASALYAQRTAPKTDWRATERCSKYHDGKTDSFCLARYAKNHYGNQNTNA